VSFVCDSCQTTVTKPRVKKHQESCRYAVFTCIDCSTRFDSKTVHNHTSCVTEAEKWHGKFAKKKKGQSPQNNNNKAKAQSTPKNENSEKSEKSESTNKAQQSTPKYENLEKSEKSEETKVNEVSGVQSELVQESKKRKREEEIGQGEKKQKVQENNESVTKSLFVVDLEELKWKKTTKKCLKKSGGKMEVVALKQNVVDVLMIDIRNKAEQVFDQKIQNNNKVKIKKNKASLKKKVNQTPII